MMSNTNQRPGANPVSLTNDLFEVLQEGYRVNMTGAQLLAGLGAIRTTTASAAVALGDVTVIVDATGGNNTQTLPAAASATGREFVIKKKDASANTVTVKGNGTELIDGANTKVIAAQYGTARVKSDGVQYWVQ
ncbi:hypothetical protein [Paraburkholderia sartisoli]|uniref:Uncharacterized protein n=1 Tax=Paraburkholderia sartisoli TaxID=83784 RepID=A0A1H4HSZ2_9BURK|nr:hypothetical protein [Paraburkholderia sartisoli]SEB24791.1 hypothetical protein SAMN05192564_11539 [Paraburkholderia sartisoli]